MSAATLEASAEALHVARLQAAVLASSGRAATPGASVLDLGCGDGGIVAGWLKQGADAHGCDFAVTERPAAAALRAEGRLRAIELAPAYRLPYPDASFDFVVSNQVFEHVRDYPATIRETRRVLRPGGRAVHVFPSRLVPIEPHVNTPFGGALQSRFWISLWARAGVRSPRQRRMTWREAAAHTHRFLSENTNYLRGGEIRNAFEAEFQQVRYAERAFLENSPNKRGRMLAQIGSAAPPLFYLYRVFWSRVIVCERGSE